MLPFEVFYSLFGQNNIVKNKVILPYKYGRKYILFMFIFVVGMLLCNNFLLSKPIACALEQPYKAKSFRSSFGFSSIFFKFYSTFLRVYRGISSKE
ncbi:MIT family metal ion transporter CorA [Prevotella nigrescens ATCC 33563]|nr:MIT family metal ion transporter CorA [Prevotella nigrescens ATCC 33563]